MDNELTSYFTSGSLHLNTFPSHGYSKPWHVRTKCIIKILLWEDAQLVGPGRTSLLLQEHALLICIET